MDIIAHATDVMQGEKFMYFGLYSPTLVHVLEHLQNLNNLKFCSQLKDKLISAVHTRFPDIMNKSNLKASLLNPIFKNFKFLKNDREK